MIRTELREHIFKLLFQEEFNQEEDMQEHLKYYFMTLENAADKDKDYIQEKYEAVAGHIAEIDELINQYAKGWKTTRMNKVDLAILRLAVYEMKWDEEVPVGVAINEAEKHLFPKGCRESWRRDSAVETVRPLSTGYLERSHALQTGMRRSKSVYAERRYQDEECLYGETGQFLY